MEFTKSVVRVVVLLQAVICSAAHAAVSDASNIDQGWRLWLDPTASWRDDALYLPEEVDLQKLPVNAPTGGWSTLDAAAGIGVSLPATVEQFYFGRSPARIPASTRPADVVAAEGNYIGVSWWYRPFTPPALRPGERLVFHFPAGRLRSEVYVNGKLVGYSILSEAPFDADATNAIEPGKPNQLAVRITNPGGRLDWIDFLTMHWGKYTLPATHGFGGLAGGVEMQVRGPVSVSDLAVFNKPDPHSVHLQAEISSTGPAYDGPIDFSIEQNGKVYFHHSDTIHVPAGQTATVSTDATVPDGQLWDINQPNLYAAIASLPPVAHSTRDTAFGFRWLEPKGLGSDAKLYLNGRHIVPRSSISWGYWAPNGIFPDLAAAQREVVAAQALGLTSIQNHRHMPKEVVLDAFDRAGLLRYCEAGCGLFTYQGESPEKSTSTGPIDTTGTGARLDFLNRYQLDKELAMIHTFRSHPCVSVWTLQNETSPDLHNPKIFYALNMMREADPSRCILLKSGDDVNHQVWTLPYRSEWLHDDGTGYSGWRDQHTATKSPGVWVDSMYTSTTDFKYRSDNYKEIVVWGELATGASPDDHTAMVNWYAAHHTLGYDLAAHQTIVAAYENFLDTYGFRSAFPTAEKLFQEAGAKHYFSAAHLLENARMSSNVDYIVLSGWESTTVDNHSGMVDSLRQLKANPTPIHQASEPERLVVRLRHSVIATGDAAVVDVHQINEQNLTGTWRLSVSASMPGHAPLFQADCPVELKGGDDFGQLLKDNIHFPVNEAGPVMIHATLSDNTGATPLLSSDEPLLVINPAPAPLRGTIACGGASDSAMAALKRQFNADPAELSPAAGKLDTILITTTAGGASNEWAADLHEAIRRARRDGTRVVLLTSGGNDADAIARSLADQGLLQANGTVGASGESWMGFWFFGRNHWLLDGLPSDCVLDWQYQIEQGNGLLLRGPGLQAIIGYGKDHDPRVGVAAATIACGKGDIVLLAIPGLMNSFTTGNAAGFHPVTAKRLMFNALAGGRG